MGRRKQWIDSFQGVSKTLSDSNSPLIAVDLLADLESDDYAGITVARIIGHVSFNASAETTPSVVSGNCAAGIVVLSRQFASNAVAGASTIPDPARTTASQHEAAWYWKAITPRIYSSGVSESASVEYPYIPSGMNVIGFDIRSKRKLQAGDFLAVVLSQIGWTTTHEPGARVWARTLILLP